jgi:hypothetical protein
MYVFVWVSVNNDGHLEIGLIQAKAKTSHKRMLTPPHMKRNMANHTKQILRSLQIPHGSFFVSTTKPLPTLRKTNALSALQ